MLARLSIRDIVLIERLDIEFARGLAVLTGETGAGKSILLDAFALPTRPKAEWPIDAQIAVMRRDKKASAGQLRFILPTRLGEVRLFDDVPESLVREVLGRP